jgi:hypothetical protein
MGTRRTSLDGEGACWADRSCNRVMTCAHGGEWNATIPYDSMPAFMKAYEDGADAVKGGIVIHLLNCFYCLILTVRVSYVINNRFSRFERQYWCCNAL